MHEENRRIEALKSLGDWSKWVLSIETLSVVGVAIGKQELLKRIDATDLQNVLWLLFVSITAATLLVGGIPTAIQGNALNSKDQQEVHFYHVWRVLPFWFLAFIEHIGFLLALLVLISSL